MTKIPRHLVAFARELPLAFCLVMIANGAQADFTVERVVDGLNQPMFMTQAPGDNTSLYVVERNDGGNQLGRIRKFDLQSQSLTTFLDLTGSITSDGGVLSMAFHPDYESNGLFYVTSNINGDNRLEEYQTVAGTPQFQRRLFQYDNLENVFHTINQPFFRPGGDPNELFLTTGDGGTQANDSDFDPDLIESLDSPYGKLLKLDLSQPFATPANDTTAAGVDVVAYGLRNPFRSSFDRATGDMYLGDVGFEAVEEVNFIPAGHFDSAAAPLNFGWTDREGTIEAVNSVAGGPKEPGDLDPIFDYAHNSGVPLPHDSEFYGGSITGGYVYRGPVAELQGRYFLTDFLAQRIYSGVFDSSTDPANYNGENLVDLQRHDDDFEALVTGGANIRNLTSFAEDNAGNLYMVKFGNGFFPALGQGEIFRIAPIQAISAVVNRETGAITLTNNTGEEISLASLTISSPFGAIDPGALTPITGNYDSDGDESVDSDNVWTVTSAVGSHTLFSEQSTGTPGTLGIGQQVVLSPSAGWIPSPTQDLTLLLLDGDSDLINVNVDYAGNLGTPFSRSDLDFDGVLSVADWSVFVAGAAIDLSSMSAAQAYGQGDLDGDGDNDYDDFQLFKSDYIQSNGAAAFQSLFSSAPEPNSLLLLMTAFIAAFCRKQSRGKP